VLFRVPWGCCYIMIYRAGSRGVLSRVHMHRIQALDFDPTGALLVTYGGYVTRRDRVA
jgi:hypothetical protein